MQRLQRISIATDSGTLLLASPHGPLLWLPAVRAPVQDADGVFDLFGPQADRAAAVRRSVGGRDGGGRRFTAASGRQLRPVRCNR